MKASLQIIYEGDYGRPLTAARIEDRQILIQAAKIAITEAFQKAEGVAEVDAFLGTIHQDEAERLAKVLGMLIPELATHPSLHLVKKPASSPRDFAQKPTLEEEEL